ncbi:hypothetical protein EG68_04707 [Paragonimus skrjabini miyazakii]|uniref:DNA/RNA-binding domain-containing protein n=1 Tax=Paragonimus skrjabini miyazakii TaxID=59628 RepID=A0A8S9YR09_9TREM|nr:hypothetical protein EG68_04707 [Paragonimus skrjabini miyazakii]
MNLNPFSVISEEATEYTHQSKLFKELRLLVSHKPPENSAPSVHDEYHLRLQEIYVEIISRFPQLAVENKLELDMWNNLYKTQIDALRNTLLRRATTSETALTVGGHPRSTMELKLRFVLLLDRASGVYLALIHRLLHSLPDTTWPKSILAAVTSPAAPTGLFKFDQLGRTSGRFDLDLVTFSALQRFNTSLDVTTLGSNVNVVSPVYSRWLAQKLKAEAITGTAPRILSRGDRLPAVQHHTEDNLKSSSAQRDSSGESVPAVNRVVSASSQSNTMEDTKTKSELADSPPVDHMNAVNYIIQHCLLHLGDVARYRQPANVATGYYLWAWLVHPDSGHPYNQLAILESAKGSKTRVDALFYYFVRAIACRYPFPAAMTNLRRFLRTNLSLDRLHRTNNTISHSDNSFRYILYTFLACLQLSVDPSVLATIAYKFVTISSHCADQFPKSVDYQWLLRLVTVHVYLLAECANTLQTDPPWSQSADTSENSNNKNYEVGYSLLLHVTVHLLDWIARQYMAWSSTADHKGQSDPGLLAALVVILLWLRRHALASSAVLDAAFRVHAFSVSELSVCLMNNLLAQFSERSCDQYSNPPVHTFSEQKYKDDLLSSQLDWQSLLQLPELALLQGFLPLGVPCQRTLCTTGTKLTTSPPFTFIRSRLETFHGCDLIALDGNQVSCSNQHVSNAECRLHTCSSAIHRTRVQLIVESARIIADLLPSLIGWSDDPSDEPHSVHLKQCLRGHFQHVHRYQPTISQLIPTFSPKPTRTVPAVMEAHQMSKDSLIPGAPPNIQNSSNEGQSITVSPVDYTGVPLENTSEPPPVSSAIPANSSPDWLASAVNQCPTDSDPTDSRTLAQSPISSTRNVISHSSVPHEIQVDTCSNLSSTSIPVSSSPNVFSGPTSGGLIVNAELAKFIQEQASQVAARQQQQRVELSAGLAEAGDTKTPTSRYFDSSFANSGYLKGGRSNSSRLCLSAAFRKDLPPRFARRLQAELLEREQRLGTSGNSELVDPLKSPILVDLTKPAPLARKESEDPFELDSLLSANITSKTLDQVAFVPTSIAVTATSCSQFLLPVDRQLSFAPVISNPLMTRYQNASLNVSAGPLPSSTGLSLYPTSTFSLPPPLPLVPPDYSSMVSSLMHASSAGLAPRVPFTENNWHNSEPVHEKNHTSVAQPGFPTFPPTSFMLPSYTTVPGSNDTLHAIIPPDSFRGPLFANAEQQSVGMMHNQLYASLIERDHARAALYKDVSVSSAFTSVNTNSVSEENTTGETADDVYAKSHSGSLASFLSAGNTMQSFNHPNVP